MDQDQKISYMDIACRVAGFGLKKQYVELIVECYELIIAKEGKADVNSMVAIEWKVKEKYEAIEREEMAKKTKVKIDKDENL
jgi:cell division protein FtsB